MTSQSRARTLVLCKTVTFLNKQAKFDRSPLVNAFTERERLIKSVRPHWDIVEHYRRTVADSLTHQGQQILLCDSPLLSFSCRHTARPNAPDGQTRAMPQKMRIGASVNSHCGIKSVSSHALLLPNNPKTNIIAMLNFYIGKRT